MDLVASGIMLVWHAMFGINSLIDPAKMVDVILGTGQPSKSQVWTVDPHKCAVHSDSDDIMECTVIASSIVFATGFGLRACAHSCAEPSADHIRAPWRARNLLLMLFEDD